MLVRYLCLVLMTSCLYSEIGGSLAQANSKLQSLELQPFPISTTTGRRNGGWLDRVVAYYKEKFIEDVERTQKIKLDVTLEKAPEGYKDSPEWNETSVLRLISLVHQTASKPVRRAFRRALKPVMVKTRRMYYTPSNSRIMFPSLKKTDPNHFYYSDTEYEEEKDNQGRGDGPPADDYYDSYEDEEHGEEAQQRKKKREEWNAAHRSVVVVRNPVEARLPSSRISLALLRKIMEERALAARAGPSSTKITVTWLPRFKSTKKLHSTTPRTAEAPPDKPGEEPPATEDPQGEDKPPSEDKPPAGEAPPATEKIPGQEEPSKPMTVEEAVEAANKAKEDAESAMGIAETQKDNAMNAATVEEAQTAAGTASTEADNAAAAAERATDALKVISEADPAVDQAVADKAKTDAEAAQTAAKQAKQHANMAAILANKMIAEEAAKAAETAKESIAALDTQAEANLAADTASQEAQKAATAAEAARAAVTAIQKQEPPAEQSVIEAAEAGAAAAETAATTASEHAENAKTEAGGKPD